MILKDLQQAAVYNNAVKLQRFVTSIIYNIIYYITSKIYCTHVHADEQIQTGQDG